MGSKCPKCGRKVKGPPGTVLGRHFASEEKRDVEGYCPGVGAPSIEAPRDRAWADRMKAKTARKEKRRRESQRARREAIAAMKATPLWSIPLPEFVPLPEPAVVTHLRHGGHHPEGERARRNRLDVTCNTCRLLILHMRYAEFAISKEYTKNRRFRVHLSLPEAAWVLTDTQRAIPRLLYPRRMDAIRGMWALLPLIDKGPRQPSAK